MATLGLLGSVSNTPIVQFRKVVPPGPVHVLVRTRMCEPDREHEGPVGEGTDRGSGAGWPSQVERDGCRITGVLLKDLLQWIS